MSNLDIALMALTYLFGGVVKGAIGFGLPLVAISITPYILPISQALAINVLVALIANFLQFVQSDQREQAVKQYWTLLPAVAVGAAIGASIVASISENLMNLVLGLFILFFVATSYSPLKLSINKEVRWWTDSLFGLIVGLSSSITSSPGAIYVTYLLALGTEKKLFVGTLGFLLFCGGCFVLSSYGVAGLLSWSSMAYGLLFVIPTWAGMYTGRQIANRVSAKTFYHMVLIGLALLALNMIRKGLFS